MKNITKFSVLLATLIVIITGFGFSAEDPVIKELRAVNKKISAYLALGDTDEVNVLVNGLLEKHSDNATVKLFAADKYSRLEKHELAVELISDLDLSLFPEGFYTPLLIGEIYHSAGEYKMAKQYLEKAIEYEGVFQKAYDLLEDCDAKL